MLGFNADLAPVADVWSNPDNTVIGDRAYSDDFAQAAVSALEEAVALGEISEERINQSVRRILAMKVNRGVLKLEG